VIDDIPPRTFDPHFPFFLYTMFRHSECAISSSRSSEIYISEARGAVSSLLPRRQTSAVAN